MKLWFAVLSQYGNHADTLRDVAAEADCVAGQAENPTTRTAPAQSAIRARRSVAKLLAIIWEESAPWRRA
jgi:hypothetical protein